MLLALLLVPFIFSNSETLTLTSDITLQWSIYQNSINFTLGMSTSLGWVGIGWKDPSIGGGMAGCDMFVIENGKVTDLYSDSNSWPLEDSEQDCSIVAKSENTNGKIYYTVNKLNPSKDSYDRTITDMTYQLQYAWGTSQYGDHHRNFGKKSVNFFKQADFVNTTDYQGGSADNGGSTDNGGTKNNTVVDNEDSNDDDLDDNQDGGNDDEGDYDKDDDADIDVDLDVSEDNSGNNSDDNLEDENLEDENLEDENLEDDKLEDDKLEDDILVEEKEDSNEQLYQTTDNSNLDSASLLLISYFVALLI